MGRLRRPKHGPVRAIRYRGPFPSFVDCRGVPVAVGEVGLVPVAALHKFHDYEPAQFEGDPVGLDVRPWPDVDFSAKVAEPEPEPEPPPKPKAKAKAKAKAKKAASLRMPVMRGSSRKKG